jgi:ankyrin repeat protein
MLIDGGADLNVIDEDGHTSLHWACDSTNDILKKVSPEIIRVLILAGADTQVRDSQGHLPVELLESNDEESRAIYEEAVVEVDSQALKPVLK